MHFKFGLLTVGCISTQQPIKNSDPSPCLSRAVMIGQGVYSLVGAAMFVYGNSLFTNLALLEH